MEEHREELGKFSHATARSHHVWGAKAGTVHTMSLGNMIFKAAAMVDVVAATAAAFGDIAPVASLCGCRLKVLCFDGDNSGLWALEGYGKAPRGGVLRADHTQGTIKRYCAETEQFDTRPCKIVYAAAAGAAAAAAAAAPSAGGSGGGDGGGSGRGRGGDALPDALDALEKLTPDCSCCGVVFIAVNRQHPCNLLHMAQICRKVSAYDAGVSAIIVAV
jgi:hypothetical protein